MQSYKPNQWIFFLRKYQGGDVVILRKVVRHADTIMYYNFAALAKDQAHFIGFQSLPKPGPAQTKYYYTDPEGKRVEVK